MIEYPAMPRTVEPPESPTQGDMWFDQDAGHVYVWLDTRWVQASKEPVTKVPDTILGKELLYEDEIAELTKGKT